MVNKKPSKKIITVKKDAQGKKNLVKTEVNKKFTIARVHPIVTEKAVMSIERDNVLTFEMDKKASKKEIAYEIENLFDVKVQKVRTSIRGSEKYAYVKLKKEFLAIDIATKLGII